MSQQNIEVLRGLQEAFNAGDVTAALEAFDPEAEWQQAREDPDAETLHGRQAIRRLWESWREAYPDLRVEAEEVITAAERVFVWVRITGHGGTSGAEVAQEEAYVYTFRDGHIVRLEEYFDRQEGLRAAGITE
jgi:ketosteroid isomerase-like protein